MRATQSQWRLKPLPQELCGLWQSLLLCLLLTFTSNALAAEDLSDPQIAADTVAEVLADRDFGEEREETYWALKSDRPDVSESLELEGMSLMLARLGEFFLWLLLLVLAITLIANYGRFKNFLTGNRSVSHASDRPSVMFGMEITKDSLPDDVPGTAWRLWQQGDHSGAISLLYRGALATLVDRDGIRVGVAATEGDCIRTVRQRSQRSLGDYFERLTHSWVKLAYAHELPAAEQVEEFCQQWPSHFNAKAEVVVAEPDDDSKP